MANLILYYSRKGENYVNGSIQNISKGNTERVAEFIQRAVGGDLFEIEPVREYSASYMTCIKEAQAEQRGNERPAVRKLPESLDGYDTIFIGYPNWWGTMPIAIHGFNAKQKQIEGAFVKWISAKYNMLSGVVDRKRPVLLSKVNDFIRKGNDRIALIVMDGMSFENYFTIQRMLEHEAFSYDVQAAFSFFPTVTSVARQSIFSGKLPQEHSKPFSLENEEKQWFSYWQEHGYRASEIAFIKEEEADILPQTKVVGIVVNICDDLMHDELQGLDGLQQGVENWTKNMHLVHLLTNLLEKGFAVYMTADHGNTSAMAQGRFQKPGVLAEPASRRAVIYQSYADALELDKFTTTRYSGTYLPKGYTTYLFEAGTCYGDRGKEYITHGGMTLEEAVVPFVWIGEYNG